MNINLFFLILICLYSYSNCSICFIQKRKQINGLYKNLINYYSGAIIATARNNNFVSTQIVGSLLRDQIYFMNSYNGSTSCTCPCDILINLLQKQVINTIIFRLWDGNSQVYDVYVYLQYQNQENLVYHSTTAFSVLKITFSPQFVDRVRFYTQNGNTNYPILALNKVLALYQY